MVGSTLGWREVPYVSCPADAAALAGGVIRIEDERLAIIPGVRTAPSAVPDVMRGEEVQLLGATILSPPGPNDRFCQPGTHCKWAIVTDGKIRSFATAMTGEIFALLREGSSLAPFLASPVVAGEAFRQGVLAAAGEDLLGALFTARSGVLLGTLPIERAPSFVSGLLIGADVGARRVAGKTVNLVAEAPLDGLYAAAIELLGGNVRLVDSGDAFVAGMQRIRSLLDDQCI